MSSHWRIARARQQRAVFMRTALVLSLGLVSSACVTRGGDIPYAPTDFGAPDFETRGAVSRDVPLGPLDEIEVKVFQVEDLSGTYQVGADGSLEMPLIGAVDARNLSANQFARKLETLYAKRFLANPQISVRITDGGQQNITVEGGVNNPGVFPVRGSATLLEALALARGVDPQNGNPRRVAIFRKMGGRTTAAAFDVVDIRRGLMENPSIYPGDIVVVDGSGTRAIYRDIIQALPTLALFQYL